MNTDQILGPHKGEGITGVHFLTAHGADFAVDQHITVLNDGLGHAAGDGAALANVATTTLAPRAGTANEPKSTRTDPANVAEENNGAPFVATSDSDSGTPIVGDIAVKFENLPPPENVTPLPRSLPSKSIDAPAAAL